MKSTTKVIFRKFRNEVLALFPGVAGTLNPETCSSYVHTGQHGSADLRGVVPRSRLARPKEYADLATELRRIGYKLRIAKRASRADYISRCEQTKA